MSFFKQVSRKGNYYTIADFPRRNFLERLKREYGTIKLSYLLELIGFTYFAKGSVRIHAFFIPELLYLLAKFRYPLALRQTIIDNTWMKDCYKTNFPSRVDLDVIKKETNITPKPYQTEFLTVYDQEKSRYQLRGYLLSFEQGLGKTITSILLMATLKKKKIFVFAPNRLVETVWENEINEIVFKQPKKCFVINRDVVGPDYDFYLYNYEGIEKALDFIKKSKFHGDDIGIIVDESHNFLTQGSKRTNVLVDFIEQSGCDDTLLMSGTPLKALGMEMMPLLMMLDRLFDADARAIFKKALGVNVTTATDILNARLNIFMHRKKKEEVLDLPPKTEIVVKVPLPNGLEYTAKEVQKTMKAYAEARYAYHNPRMPEYIAQFTEAMEWVELNHQVGRTMDFRRYLGHIASFRKKMPDIRDPATKEVVMWVNNYEKTVLIPILPPLLKKQFIAVRAAVKYLSLKVQGEVLGQCLTAMRARMTREIAEASDLASHIRETALKKTVIFTSYVDTVEHVMDYLKKNKFQAVAAYGKTNHDIKNVISTFKKNPKVNPLVATIQSLSTGVTLTEADYMAMLNRPWRITDYLQASDRIHRIGQDSPVTIATFELDTGEEPNLSTRMADILAMSQLFFDSVVDGEDNHVG